MLVNEPELWDEMRCVRVLLVEQHHRHRFVTQARQRFSLIARKRVETWAKGRMPSSERTSSHSQDLGRIGDDQYAVGRGRALAQVLSRIRLRIRRRDAGWRERAKVGAHGQDRKSVV